MSTDDQQQLDASNEATDESEVDEEHAQAQRSGRIFASHRWSGR